MRVFVVWEPVLPTDWFAPSTSTLKRISDPHTKQFWDKGRLISHSMGEHNRRSIVWDYVAVYPPGAIWKERPPQALYQGGPVIRVTKHVRAALAQTLQKSMLHHVGEIRCAHSRLALRSSLCTFPPPSVERDQGPHCFDKPEGPCALQEPVS